MPTNPYFNNYHSTIEQRLIEDLMIETIKINGVDCNYLPNDNEESRDLLYGEDPLRTFSSSYPIEIYVVNVDGYAGDREFFSKFGLEIKNQMEVILSKRGFSRWLPQSRLNRPREGDLIFIPFLSQNGELYEIKYVDYSDSFYVLGNKYPYFYKLSLEKFKYSQERIDVGVPEIDDTPGQDAYAQELYMSTGSGNYEEKESVVQGNTATGIVVSWNVPNKLLKVTTITGYFSVNSTVVGVSSNASWAIQSFDPLENVQEREMADNEVVETEASGIIDNTEHNPFGSIS